MFISSKNYSQVSALQLLQRGASGAYKSRAAMRLGLRWGSVLFMDLDGNFAGLMGMIPPECAEDVTVTNFLTPESRAAAIGKDGAIDLEQVALTQLSNFDRWLGEMYTKPTCDFNTVVLDTYTSLALLVEKQVMRVPEFRDPKNTLKKYGAIKTCLTAMIGKLKSLPCNVIINAHEAPADGGLEIVGIGSAHNLWDKFINEKVRLRWAQPGKLAVVTSGADGLKTAFSASAGPDGVVQPASYWPMYDSIAKCTLGAPRAALKFPGERF